MTGTCRRLLVAAHRWLFATLTLLGSIQRAVHSWLDHHPHAAFLKSWHGWPVPAPPPVAPAKPGPIYPPPSPVYAIGTYQAGTVLWPLPAAAAQAMLPEGLVLGPQSLFPPGQHPALFLFGHHQGVRPNILHVLGMDYLEFLIAIPHVQWKTATNPYRGPFAFMPRLYLDRLLPVLGGWLYGYAKRRARIRADERTYEVRSLLGNSPLITGRFTPRGNPGPLSAFPNFAELAELFQQPFVAQTLLGFFCCSHQDFELDQATMQALEADVDVATAFLPGLPTGSRHFSGIDQVPRGAFRIRVPWTLPPPFDCACLRVRFPADPFPQ